MTCLGSIISSCRVFVYIHIVAKLISELKLMAYCSLHTASDKFFCGDLRLQDADPAGFCSSDNLFVTGRVASKPANSS